jgi:hypothetical protein
MEPAMWERQLRIHEALGQFKGFAPAGDGERPAQDRLGLRARLETW